MMIFGFLFMLALIAVPAVLIALVASKAANK